MLERDYLMRLMKSFIDAIGKIAKLKKEKQFEQVLSLVDEQLSMLLRLRAKHVNSLSEDDLLKLMNTYGKLEGEKVLMVAALTEDQADVYELMGNEMEAYRLRLRALRLYLHAAPTLADGEAVDYAARIEALLELLKGYRLPANTCLSMMQYEEAAGRYAKAEDWLYRLAETVGATGDGRAGDDGAETYISDGAIGGRQTDAEGRGDEVSGGERRDGGEAADEGGDRKDSGSAKGRGNVASGVGVRGDGGEAADEGDDRKDSGSAGGRGNFASGDGVRGDEAEIDGGTNGEGRWGAQSSHSEANDEGMQGEAVDVTGGKPVNAEARSDLARLGEQFYERLRGIDDERMKQGNFSREEVETGLEDWRALQVR